VVLCLLIATIAGFTLGAVTERVLVRPIEKRSLLATLIVLLGLSLPSTRSTASCGKPEPLDAEPVPEWRQLVHQRGRRALYWANLGVWLLVALLVGAMFQLFNRTRLGLHMRATASNRESAALAGIPTGRILLLGWASRRRSGPWQGALHAAQS